ncbi:unnamed protein product [Echinostoma caproni]|uniref:Uncharacterized protein n=1 Tax=Echinostoma caproni TaxID=27848 RepID=A0A183BG93_9TREM|nr:unnamed protein product [Echinostoma caproni]
MSGSDSDATWPATDDFGSRFLEIDLYEQTKDSVDLPRFRPHRGSKGLRSDSPETRTTTESRSSQRLRRRRCIVQDEDSDSNDNAPPLGSVRSTGRRLTEFHLPVNQSPVVDVDADNSEEDQELSTFRNPKLMTARQLSLKMQRTAATESLEPPKPVSKPTPEQILARQQRIARRRESAKRKAEMEKQQTVERLLKVCIRYDPPPSRIALNSSPKLYDVGCVCVCVNANHHTHTTPCTIRRQRSSLEETAR